MTTQTCYVFTYLRVEEALLLPSYILTPAALRLSYMDLHSVLDEWAIENKPAEKMFRSVIRFSL